METISLRVYNRDIEGLIEAGKMDQAIAHCQHILKTYSMHIDTYQLLGKAYLEARRYADAIDIFQRILNAVPDDFISHVGMSIIRDDEGKLNDAIWHMERAYEVQPSNPAIQGELRRLYGKRDGIEPAKIRLSREALANMYVQGELYNQAIAEIRAILAEDPERPDLHVMLARAYYQTEQKMEAAEMATHLLKKYPYCVDALRVLVEVLPGSTKAENIQVYQQRLKLLDPYSPYALDSVFHTDQVPDDSVALGKLEQIPDSQKSIGQGAWTSSLGIKLEDDRRLQTPITPGGNQATISAENVNTGDSIPEQGDKEEPLPESPASTWWEESNGTQSATPMETIEASPEDLAKAELPEWVKTQMPPVLDETKTTSDTMPGDDVDFPDWLTSLSEEETPTATGNDDGTQENRTSEEQPVPDITSAAIPESEEGTTQTEEDGIETWLEKLAVSELTGSTSEPSSIETESPQETNQMITEEILPSSLPEDNKVNSEFTSLVDEKELQIGEEVTQAVSENLPLTEDIEEPDELISTDKEKIEDIPDWITSIAEQPEPSSILPQEEINLSKDVPDASIEPVKDDVSGNEINNIPEWLKHIGNESYPESQSETVATPKIPSLPEETQEPLYVGDTQKVVVSSSPDENIPEAPKQAEEDTTITAWLKKLDEATESKSESSVPQEDEIVTNREEDLPLWLRDLEKDKSPIETNAAPDIALMGIETPDWLDQRLEPEEVQKNPSPDEPGKDLIISEEEVAVENRGTSTIPTEWVPEENEVPSSSVNIPPEETGLPDIVEKSGSIETIPLPAAEKTSVPIVDKDAVILTSAKELLKTSQGNEAAKEYLKLIKKGKYLNEVTEDLRKAVEKYPENSMLWQTLGDLYMRSNQLQNALDAYNQAEDLLR